MGDFQGMVDALFRVPTDTQSGVTALLASLLLSTFLGQSIAWVYQRTHHGLSYSRGFTQSLVLLTLGASLLIHVIGDSLVTAFGLLGALAIVRFRNVLKDTRDTVFVLMSLILGMATGTQRFVIAIVGASVLLAVVMYLHAISFGARDEFDGHVTYRLTADPDGSIRAKVESILALFCQVIRPVTMHDMGDSVEVISAVRLRDPERGSEMVEHLRSLPGVGEASIVVRDAHVEM